jgi:hypothetical protein
MLPESPYHVYGMNARLMRHLVERQALSKTRLQQFDNSIEPTRRSRRDFSADAFLTVLRAYKRGRDIRCSPNACRGSLANGSERRRTEAHRRRAQ